ncbi:MAG: thioredoxin family protein [Acidimicrobiales bacterium]|nr:thioredoxin family protein [Acidimicrobiales bacterium]MCB1261830.1 thioredoxin family protein [Acidimicrobiales bacterium]
MRVELLYFEDCPHWREAEANLLGLQSEFGCEMGCRIINSPESAAAVGFGGSPLITVEGEELFAGPGQAGGFMCRRYETPAGDEPAGGEREDAARI